MSWIKKIIIPILLIASFLAAMHECVEEFSAVDSLVKLSTRAVIKTINSDQELYALHVPIDLKYPLAHAYLQKGFKDTITYLTDLKPEITVTAYHCMPALSDDGTLLAYCKSADRLIIHNLITHKTEKEYDVTGRLNYLFFDQNNRLRASIGKLVFYLDPNFERYDFSNVLFIGGSRISKVSAFVSDNENLCFYDRDENAIVFGSVSDLKKWYKYTLSFNHHFTNISDVNVLIQMYSIANGKNTLILKTDSSENLRVSTMYVRGEKANSEVYGVCRDAVNMNSKGNILSIDVYGNILEEKIVNVENKEAQLIKKKLGKFSFKDTWLKGAYIKETDDDVFVCCDEKRERTDTKNYLIFKYLHGIHYYAMPAGSNHVQITKSNLLMTIDNKTTFKQDSNNFYSEEPFKVNICRLPKELRNHEEEVNAFIKDWK